MLLLLFATLMIGQARSPNDSFLSIKTFRCDFSDANGRTYPDDGSGPTVTGPEELKDIVLDAIDYRANTARLVGNAGADTVRVIRGERSTSFLEVSDTGNPILITVFRTPRSKTAQSTDTYPAVMSRHIAQSVGVSRATQMYGACKALR